MHTYTYAHTSVHIKVHVAWFGKFFGIEPCFTVKICQRFLSFWGGHGSLYYMMRVVDPLPREMYI